MNGVSNTSNTKPLVFVIEALTVGGAEQMLIAMANRFAQQGHIVHVVCLTTWGELADRLDEGVERHLLDKKPGVDPKLPGKLRRLIKEIDPAAVNSHLFTANLWTRLALMGSGVRVVVTEHSRDFWKGKLYRFLDRVFIYACHRLIGVSQDTAEFYRDEIGLPDARVDVINNGIETSIYAAGNGDALRAQWENEYPYDSSAGPCVYVGMIGRLVEAKNHMRLLDAAEQWVSSAPRIRTLIVGDGHLAESIDESIRARNLESHVYRLGARSDIPNILQALDIFVLSSDREGHPLTALEAQAAGTPVVLTRAGGCEDALAREGDKAGGFLVERDAAQFADAVAVLANDEDKRLEMGRFAQTFALENFDLDQMVDRYRQVMLD